MAEKYSDLLEQYQNDGFIILRNVLDADLIEECRRHIEYLQVKYPSIPGEHLHHPIMRNDPFWVRLLSDPRLLDLAAVFGTPFIEPDGGIALFSSHYFCKPPKKGMAVLWHQDGTIYITFSSRDSIAQVLLYLGSYWPLKPMNVLTMWVAIDDSDRENGCLRVVRGSHRQELANLTNDVSVQNVLGSFTHRDEDIDPDKIVDLILKPGGKQFNLSNLLIFFFSTFFRH